MTAAPRSPETPTHAGGIVRRCTERGLEYLLVRPTGGEDHWVLPKGHIEAGETVEEAALREVLEEAGALADLGAAFEPLHYHAKGSDVLCVFHRMDFRAQGASSEDREVHWATLDQIRGLMPFPDTVALIEEFDREGMEQRHIAD